MSTQTIVGTFVAQQFKLISLDPNTIFRVFVCPDRAAALEAIATLSEDPQFAAAARGILVEERLDGREVSVMAITDGRTICQRFRTTRRPTMATRGPTRGAWGPTAQHRLLMRN